MVFRIYRSKFPGAKAPARERPCLEHVQLHLRLSAALFLSLVSFKQRILWDIERGFCGLALAPPTGMDKASCLISMVFEICHPKPAGAHTLIREKPCLDNLLLSRFWQPSPEYLPHNQAANLISMVSILAARYPLDIYPAIAKHHAYLTCYLATMGFRPGSSPINIKQHTR